VTIQDFKSEFYRWYADTYGLFEDLRILHGLHELYLVGDSAIPVIYKNAENITLHWKRVYKEAPALNNLFGVKASYGRCKVPIGDYTIQFAPLSTAYSGYTNWINRQGLDPTLMSEEDMLEHTGMFNIGCCAIGIFPTMVPLLNKSGEVRFRPEFSVYLGDEFVQGWEEGRIELSTHRITKETFSDPEVRYISQTLRSFREVFPDIQFGDGLKDYLATPIGTTPTMEKPARQPSRWKF